MPWVKPGHDDVEVEDDLSSTHLAAANYFRSIVGATFSAGAGGSAGLAPSFCA